MAIWHKNLQDDYGAPCAGEEDDTYFADFRTFAVAHPGDEFFLTFPASSTITTVGQTVFEGIKSKLTVEGQGATWTGTSIALSSGGIGVDDASPPHTGWYGAFTEEANIGDTTVTLLGSSDQLAPGADTSLFTPGEMAVMTGLDFQGEGYPASPFYMDFVRIVSVDSGAKTVTFTPALTKQYKKTWPSFDVYPSSGGLHGGPATLIRCATGWDTEFIFNNINFDPPGVGQQIYSGVRSATFNNCTCTDPGGVSGPIPTANQFFTINGGTWNNAIEADKLVGQFTINGGIFNNKIICQSPTGADLTIINDATIAFLQGTSRRIELHRCTIAHLILGPAGYGLTEEVWLDNNVISECGFYGAFDSTIDDGSNSMTAGVITAVKSSTPTRQTILPDRHYAWGYAAAGAFYFGGPSFTITEYTDLVAGVRDASNVFITTDLSTGFPTVAGVPPNALAIKAYVVQKRFRANDNTGCAQAVDWSQAGAQNKPIGSYSHRVIDTFVSGTQLLPWIYLVGKIVSIDINVTTAYTGSSGTAILQLRGDEDVHKRIDLRTTGLRTITPGSVVGAVGVDDITTTGTSDWFWDGNISGSNKPTWYFPDIGAETSDKWPVVTITIVTDQGFSFDPLPVQGSVSPLQLRLR